MSNMPIGDKTLTPMPSPMTDRAGEQARSGDGRKAAATPEVQGDQVALSSTGTDQAERPLSTRISNPRQAMVALLELKGRLHQAPEQALEAHAGIRSGATHALTQALNGSA